MQLSTPYPHQEPRVCSRGQGAKATGSRCGTPRGPWSPHRSAPPGRALGKVNGWSRAGGQWAAARAWGEEPVERMEPGRWWPRGTDRAGPLLHATNRKIHFEWKRGQEVERNSSKRSTRPKEQQAVPGTQHKGRAARGHTDQQEGEAPWGGWEAPDGRGQEPRPQPEARGDPHLAGGRRAQPRTHPGEMQAPLAGLRAVVLGVCKPGIRRAHLGVDTCGRVWTPVPPERWQLWGSS